MALTMSVVKTCVILSLKYMVTGMYIIYHVVPISFLPIIFSDNSKEIEYIKIKYYLTKTNHKRDVEHFSSSERIMGNKYNLGVHITVDTIKYTIPFIQFIVADELSVCSPYIDDDKYSEL